LTAGIVDHFNSEDSAITSDSEGCFPHFTNFPGQMMLLRIGSFFANCFTFFTFTVQFCFVSQMSSESSMSSVSGWLLAVVAVRKTAAAMAAAHHVVIDAVVAVENTRFLSHLQRLVMLRCGG